MPSMSGIATKIMVRVIARAGKFLGDDIGGALVTIHDARSGELLASGRTTGGSGPTEAIMQMPRTRNQPIPTLDPPKNNACFFEASLRLESPRLVEISALGPLAAQQSANRVTATTWVYPGLGIAPPGPLREGIRQDGFLLEIPGLLVQVLSPPQHYLPSNALPKTPIPISANVTMMCGCPINSPSSTNPWPDTDFQVGASILHNGKTTDLALTFDANAPAPSQFTASWVPGDYGAFEITVWAFQISTGNAGVDHTSVSLQRKKTSAAHHSSHR
jgi:hypothetical protein